MQAKIVKVEPTSPPSLPPPTPRAIIALASLSGLLASLDSAVNIAFPAISTAFHVDVSHIQWIVVSYVLTYASLLLGCGRVADLLGHSRVLLWGLTGSILAFLACGFAPSFLWLLTARILQGVSVALMLAAAPALVTLAAPPDMRGRALGLFQMGAAMGFALGPLLGGVLVDAFNWRAVYLFRIFPAILLIFLVIRRPIPRTQPVQETQGFDFPGIVTLAGSVAGILLALNRSRDLGWASPFVLALLVGSGGCFASFLAVETRVRDPIVDLGLFRHSAFALANLLNVLANCTMFAIWLLVPYYLVNILGYPATTGGLLLMACPLTTALTAPLVGRLVDKLGTGLLSVVGLGFETIGLWGISSLDASAPTLEILAMLGLVGLGLGVFQVPNMSFVMGAIPREQQGVAGGMSQMMRTLGIVLGVTGASILFDDYRASHAARLQLVNANDIQTFLPAFQNVFLISTIGCAAAVCLALLRRQDSMAT